MPCGRSTGACRPRTSLAAPSGWQIRSHAPAPDLVGLQEVTLWRSGPLELPPATPTPATTVEYDFLRLLRRELSERGRPYTVVASTRNADIEVPSALTGQDLRLTDRDVILARSDYRRRGMRLRNVQEYNFSEASQLSVTTSVGTLDFTRGWNSVDVTALGRRFRLVNTHLEVQAGAPFQVAQAQELLDGPAATRLPVVMVGDFNSNADPANPDTPTYANLRAAGFEDAWARARPGESGFTCCQAPDLRNASSQLDQRIDLVLTRPRLRVAAVDVVGDAPIDRTVTAPRLWPSDHAGVVAELRLPRPRR